MKADYGSLLLVTSLLHPEQGSVLLSYICSFAPPLGWNLHPLRISPPGPPKQTSTGTPATRTGPTRLPLERERTKSGRSRRPKRTPWPSHCKSPCPSFPVVHISPSNGVVLLFSREELTGNAPVRLGVEISLFAEGLNRPSDRRTRSARRSGSQRSRRKRIRSDARRAFLLSLFFSSTIGSHELETLISFFLSDDCRAANGTLKSRSRRRSRPSSRPNGGSHARAAGQRSTTTTTSRAAAAGQRAEISDGRVVGARGRQVGAVGDIIALETTSSRCRRGVIVGGRGRVRQRGRTGTTTTDVGRATGCLHPDGAGGSGMTIDGWATESEGGGRTTATGEGSTGGTTRDVRCLRTCRATAGGEPRRSGDEIVYELLVKLVWGPIVRPVSPFSC